MLSTSRWSIPLAAIAFIIVSGIIQASIPYPLDADSAYHAAVGQLISKYGILYSFPWTPFSWFANHYADKELLFHLFFVPLAKAGISWTIATQIVGVLAESVLLTVIYIVLLRERVKFAWLWALLPIAVSFEFFYRFALVRPFLLSIALAVCVVWSAARERYWPLALASILYPLSYIAWHLPIVLICIVETARYLSSGRFRFKSILISLSGISIGVLLHPNSLNLLRLTWIEMVGVLFKTAWGHEPGIEQGRELAPPSSDIWTHCLILAVIMMIYALYCAWQNRKQDSVTLAFALTALAFFVITIKTYKFVEYFVPFSVIALALATRRSSWRLLPVMLTLVAVTYTVTLNYEFLSAMHGKQAVIPPESERFMRQSIPPGAMVFSPEWLFTGTLMQALPERRFIVALNSRYFFESDPELFRLWYRIIHEPVQDTAMLIRQRFKSRYVVCLDNETNGQFLKGLAQTPGVYSTILENHWVLLDLEAGWN